MRRIIAIFISCVMLLTGCVQTTGTISNNSVSDTVETGGTDIAIDSVSEATVSEQEINVSEETVFVEETYGYVDEEIEFGSLNDPALLQYVEDDVYASLSDQLSSENYVIENVSAIYVSQEYIDELTYNSQANVFFGYTLEEVDAQFQGTRYVFTLGENGETTVIPFEEYDDTYEQVIRNVAIGTGVILVCVTVSTISPVVGAPACVSLVFATAASTGTTYALSSGVISAVAAGAITGIQTQDFDEALRAAALQGSEGFKWGAITGVITGGSSQAIAIYRRATAIPTPYESQLEVWRRTLDGVLEVSFLDGQEVEYGTLNSTRPDVIVRNADGSVLAIEVKNYNLENASNRRELYNELARQVASRVENLPAGSTQQIVLDVRGRGFSDELIDMVVRNIHLRCDSVYPNIPVEILAY